MSTPSPVPDDPTASGQLAIEQQRTERAEVTERGRRFRAVMEALPILATMITVLIALFSSLQAQSQYRDSQAAARFQSAVEMLAGADLTTRVGGIALLGQVAQGSAERRETAVRLLATYLRVNSPITQAGRLAAVSEQPAAEEARAVFAALQFRGDVSGIDLGRISARNLMFSGTDFTGLIFSRSDLSGSLFEGSDFTGAVFKDATLRSVTFRKANLSRADFQGANVTGAQFQNANLSGANFSGATGLTAAMLAGSTTDASTKLPSGVTVP